jgi:hypothetical protein
MGICPGIGTMDHVLPAGICEDQLQSYIIRICYLCTVYDGLRRMYYTGQAYKCYGHCNGIQFSISGLVTGQSAGICTGYLLLGSGNFTLRNIWKRSGTRNDYGTMGIGTGPCSVDHVLPAGICEDQLQSYYF